jgi:O-antigen/teichoic acid export membrane protein
VLALAGALVIDPSITALAVANALSSIAVAVVWSVMTPLPFYSGDARLPVSRKEISSVFSVQLAGTAGQAFWYAPPLIASAYVGTSWAADYQIAFKVPQALLGLCGAVGGTFLPVMSSAKETDRDRLENVGAAIRVTLIVVLPIALVTIICARRFISWWTPQAGFAAAPLLQMLLIAVVVIAVFGGFWQELLASGREKLLAATQLGMSVFAVLATVVLMRWYPNTAAAIAILASSLGGCAIMLWRVGGPELHRIVGILRRSTKGLLVPVLLAVSGTSVAGRAPIESSGLRLAFAAATGLVLYAAGFLITGHYGAGIRHQLRPRR